MAKARYVTTKVPMKNMVVKVYASPKIRQALDEAQNDMSLYKGVRMTEVLESVYNQGKKDGARTAFEATERKMAEAMKSVPHKNPGKPRKH